MKDIMAKESSSEDQGVPSFAYSPADASMPLLFSLLRPLDRLGEELLHRFSGRTMSMLDIYEKHSVDTSYVAKNYKDVLGKLEQDGRISAQPPRADRPKRKGEVTFSDQTKVTFPEKE